MMIRLSIDGTWQKTGYSLHNEVVTVISLDTQKCLDVEVLSDKCQECQKWGKKTQDPRYNEWSKKLWLLPPIWQSQIQ